MRSLISPSGKIRFFGTVLVAAFVSVVRAAAAQDCLVVFASNLESREGAHREFSNGADLYCVRFNPKTRTVSELTRLTSYPDAAEWFPSLSPDTKWVAYNFGQGSSNEVRVLNRLTGAEAAVFQGGRFPEWLGNSELLVSNTGGSARDIFRVTLDLKGPLPVVVASRRLTDRVVCPGTEYASDAYPFSDGRRIAFHVLREGNTPGAAMAIMNVDGTGYRRISDWDGSGHGIVDSTGKFIVCGSSRLGMTQVFGVDDPPQAPVIIPLPVAGADLASYDSRFHSVAKAHWSYAARGRDDRSLLLSAQGSSADNVLSFSRLLYVSCDDQWQNPWIFDFSSAIEALVGKSGHDFCTASMRVIPGQLLDRGVVYVCLFMHNEDYDHPRYPNFTQMMNKLAFIESRNNLIEFCKMLSRNKVPFNWETDWNFLYGVLRWDRGAVAANTAGKNVVRYIHENLGVSVDPHSHEKYGHNYSDVAFLIELAGVGPTNVVGGHIWDPADPGYQNWERFKSPLRGLRFPLALWKGDILMGQGTSLHVNDPSPSGVWKPKGKYEYWIHDPSGTVLAVGQYRWGVQGVIDLMNLYRDGAIPAGKILTSSIGVGQFALNSAFTADFEKTILKPLLDLRAKGEIKIVTFGQLICDWETIYGSVPHIYNPPTALRSREKGQS
ncbi:MAG: hypothetical protein FJY82_02625 [Candidatus Aminicenantes bacterium]|nr:hypothetical protein [Candidatus Aminicenantes bacterium]